MSALAVAGTAALGAAGWLCGRMSTCRERRALRHRAAHDDLTGLLNREGLRQAARTALAAATRPAAAALLVDLDAFKSVNDRLGHATGDKVLREAAWRLRVTAAGYPGALAARLGGDELVALLPDLEPALAADQTAEAACRVQAALNRPYLADRRGGVADSATSLRVGASVGGGFGAGAAMGAAGTTSWLLDELLASADAAMYRAKATRGGWAIRSVDAASPDPGARAAVPSHVNRAEPVARLAD